MLDQMEAEDKVDIFGFVSGLRKQRNLMVQSLEQYVFVYKAMAEWYLFGHTDVDHDDVEKHYRGLMEPPSRYFSFSFFSFPSVSEAARLPVEISAQLLGAIPIARLTG